MTQGIKSIIYPVKDIAQAKVLYTQLLGVEPYVDNEYYVGFKVDDLDIGLDPNTHKHGTTAYYGVADINATLQALLDAGAEVIQEISDVGGGRKIASVKDVNGNIIGILSDSAE